MFPFLNTLDRNIFNWVNQSLSNRMFDIVMPFITNQNNWFLPIILLILYLLIMGGKRGRIALTILIITLILTDYISAFILKPYFARIRPSHELGDYINILVSKGGKWSMPSNHASNIVALTVILSYFYKKIKMPLYTLAITISFSRVYVGVHYPGDVIIGGLFGYGTAWMLLTFWVILKMRELKRGKTWVWYEKDLPENIN